MDGSASLITHKSALKKHFNPIHALKHLLNKTLTVKQLLALIVLPLAIVGTTMMFSVGGSPLPLSAKKINPVDSLITEIATTDTSAQGRLNAYVDSLNHSEELFGGSWSFCVTDADSGITICSVNTDRGMVPASVMKVVTTGTALSLLGPKYRFATTLKYDGTIDPKTKTLNGNIYIRGGGDPSLGAETFGSSVTKVAEAWVKAVKELGIDSIAGSIIGDAQSFDADPIPVGWTWEDIQSDYGTGPCGLNIRENVYDILLKKSKGGISLKTNPQIPGLKLYNQVLSNPSIAKSYAYVQGAPFQFERTVFGEVADTLRERSAIPDPALYCAQLLRSGLSASGIHTRDSATTVRLMRLNNIPAGTKENKKTISTSLSPTLEALVYHTNQVSQNFYAETILRAVSLSGTGYGSGSASVNIIYKFWKEKGIDLRGLCMADGCGLSRMNTITTGQLVKMLRAFSKDAAVFDAFYKSLPVAGESGTIRKLAHGTLAEGNLRAKSGTMARVKSYAGYVRTKSGKLLCFAMIGNNTQWSQVELKFKFERLFELMAELD